MNNFKLVLSYSREGIEAGCEAVQVCELCLWRMEQVGWWYCHCGVSECIEEEAQSSLEECEGVILSTCFFYSADGHPWWPIVGKRGWILVNPDNKILHINTIPERILQKISFDIFQCNYDLRCRMPLGDSWALGEKARVWRVKSGTKTNAVSYHVSDLEFEVLKILGLD